jgi:hypothetical protein
LVASDADGLGCSMDGGNTVPGPTVFLRQKRADGWVIQSCVSTVVVINRCTRVPDDAAHSAGGRGGGDEVSSEQLQVE